MPGSLADTMRLQRALRGLTLTEASEKIGIDRHTLRRIELGTQEPQYPTLLKIAKGYGLEVEGLMKELAPAGKAEAPPEPEQRSLFNDVETGEERRTYPYPWMSDTLARTIAAWTRSVDEQTDPFYSHMIAIACVDVAGSVLLVREPELKARVAEDEKRERVQVAEGLFALAERAQQHYRASDVFDPTQARKADQWRAKMVRRTREISA